MKKKPWIDESGVEIPANRVKPIERKRERYAEKLCKEAVKLNKSLSEFKTKGFELSQELYDEIMKKANVDRSKLRRGNFTWHNFDRSIKIEVSINDKETVDDTLIAACQAKLMMFIDKKMDTEDVFIRSIINDAFETSRGKLDVRKVKSLLKYRHRESDKLFQEALDLLEQAIRKPSCKKYLRIWVKNENGEYENIQLNFSAI